MFTKFLFSKFTNPQLFRFTSLLLGYTGYSIYQNYKSQCCGIIGVITKKENA